MARRRRGVDAALAITATAAAVWLASRGVSIEDLRHRFAGVHWPWVVVGAIACAVQVLMFALAWRMGLAAGGVGRMPLRHVLSATWIGRAGNAVLPAHLGEVARVFVVRRHAAPGRDSISRVAGTLVAQRVLHWIATLVVVLLVVFTVPLPVPVPDVRWAALGAPVVIATVWLARRHSPAGSWLPRRLGGIIEGVSAGAGLLRPSRAAATALGVQFMAVVAELVVMWCLLRAFGVSAPISAPLVVMAMVSLAGAVSVVPGGIGVTQAAIVVPLGAAYDVAADLALAFAVGLQATVVVVAVTGGMVGLLHQRLAAPLRVGSGH